MFKDVVRKIFKDINMTLLHQNVDMNMKEHCEYEHPENLIEVMHVLLNYENGDANLMS